MRGTKAGEEAAGGVVMAVREAGLNPFPFLLRTKDDKGEKNQFDNFLLHQVDFYIFKTIAFSLLMIIIIIISLCFCLLPFLDTYNCTFDSVIF